MTEVTLILQLLVKYGPDVAKWATKLVQKKSLPTDAEWAEIEAILAKPGASYFEIKVTP